MPELQEVSENMFFCATEVCHPGTAGRPAENCDKACDQQFAKVVPRVVGTGIWDVIEGGEEDIHVGNGLRKGDPHPRIHPAQDRKTPQIPNAIPLPMGASPIVLLSFYKRLHIVWRNQSHGMPELLKLTAPAMGSRTSLRRNNAS
jgi:hypothetical protein